jgi:GntR family transcriptional repressor for pyruvate dehydrogenase complex
MQTAHADEDFGSELDTDIELHNAIGEAAHNIILMHTLRACYRLLSEGIFHNRRMIFELPEARERLLVQHQVIVKAIIDGNPTAARAAAEAHIDYVTQAATEAVLARERQQVANLRKIQRETMSLRGVTPDARETKGNK